LDKYFLHYLTEFLAVLVERRLQAMCSPFSTIMTKDCYHANDIIPVQPTSSSHRMRMSFEVVPLHLNLVLGIGRASG